MPIYYSQHIDDFTRLAIWKIEEPEDFFLEWVPLSRRVTHPHKRLQHLAGRFLLQYLFPDFPLATIQIADTHRPFLADESHHFSISHCGQFAAAVVSTRHRVGIDIEVPTERVFRIVHKFLSHQEQQLLSEVPAGQRVHYFTLFWSVKEAMYKWYARGGEVDFIDHLQIRALHQDSASEGCITAEFSALQNLRVQLPFSCRDELVLTYLIN